ncbi:MAG: FAD-dependent oxidoreductase [Terriglobus roseus]|nr:FAD-dependent oxidoreductase [Terriglobus roseus]
MYEKPFWEESRDMFGLLNDPKQQNSLNQKDYSARRGRFYLFWNIIKTSGRPTLVALMAGDAAYQTEEDDNASLVDEVTKQLEKMFPTKDVPRPTEAIITRWRKDPFSCGSYSYVGPKTRSDDYDIMAQPWGPIHFAGEATCGTHPATVHGAYLSGLRAAAEVVDDLAGAVAVTEPLVAPSVKLEEDTPVALDLKRKFSGAPVTQQAPLSLQEAAPQKSDAEAYEASIIGAILSEIGERPIKPAKQGVNPFLLYQKDHWYPRKAEMDAEVQRKTGKADAKASKTDIRIVLGHQWRTAAEDVRKPYLDAAQQSKNGIAALTADYTDRVKRWDEDAARIREEFISKNPLPGGAEKHFSGRTAIELGRVRKNRKSNGYGEESADEGS